MAPAEWLTGRLVGDLATETAARQHLSLTHSLSLSRLATTTPSFSHSPNGDYNLDPDTQHFGLSSVSTFQLKAEKEEVGYILVIAGDSDNARITRIAQIIFKAVESVRMSLMLVYIRSSSCMKSMIMDNFRDWSLKNKQMRLVHINSPLELLWQILCKHMTITLVAK